MFEILKLANKLHKKAQEDPKKRSVKEIHTKITQILEGYFPVQYSDLKIGLKKKDFYFRMALNKGEFQKLRDFKANLESLNEGLSELYHSTVDDKGLLEVRNYAIDLLNQMEAYSGSSDLSNECLKKVEVFFETHNIRKEHQAKLVEQSISKTLTSIRNLVIENVIGKIDYVLGKSSEGLFRPSKQRPEKISVLDNSRIVKNSTNFARCLGVEPRLFGKLLKFLAETGYEDLEQKALRLTDEATLSCDLSNYKEFNNKFLSLRDEIRELTNNGRLVSQVVNKISLKQESVVPTSYPSLKKLSNEVQKGNKAFESGTISKDELDILLKHISSIVDKRNNEDNKFDSASYSTQTSLPPKVDIKKKRETHLDEVREEASSEVQNISSRIEVMTDLLDEDRAKLRELESGPEMSEYEVNSLSRKIRDREQSLSQLRKDLAEAIRNKSKVREQVKEEQEERESKPRQEYELGPELDLSEFGL